MVILLFKWGGEILRKSLTIYKQVFQRILKYIFKVSWLFTFPKLADVLHFQMNWKNFRRMWVCRSKSWQRSKIWLKDQDKDKENDH